MPIGAAGFELVPNWLAGLVPMGGFGRDALAGTTGIAGSFDGAVRALVSAGGILGGVGKTGGTTTGVGSIGGRAGGNAGGVAVGSATGAAG